MADQHPHSEPIYVVNALESAWNGQDLDALADLFDPAAVLVVEPALEEAAPESRYAGHSAIRAFLAGYVPGASTTFRRLADDGPTASWDFEHESDRLRELGVVGIAGQAWARVRGGRILELKLVLSPETAGRMDAIRAMNRP